MLVQIFLLLLLCASLSSSIKAPKASAIEDDADLLQTLTTKVLVFVSGIPQSGTSLLNALLTDAPGTSSMVKKCEEKYGTKCVNWNHEGQWLLDQEGNHKNENAIKLLQPGQQCPRSVESFNASFTSGAMNTLRRQWCQFWNLDMPILVEKSPQSMLKIPLMESTFAVASKRKYIIVIKHPATLNTAVVRGTSWLKHEHTRIDGSSVTKHEEENSVEQIDENLRYFIKFLTNGFSNRTDNSINAIGNNNNNTISSCTSLGWIPAMETLKRQLETPQGPLANAEIRIVRFEDFDRPRRLCKALINFIYLGTNSTAKLHDIAQKKVCEKHFPSLIVASTDSNEQARMARERRKHSSSHHHHRRLDTVYDQHPTYGSSIEGTEGTERRKLRLKSGEYQSSSKKRNVKVATITKSTTATSTSITPSKSNSLFRHGIIAESVALRLKSFAMALKKSSNIDQRNYLMSLENRLIQFGYSLKDESYDLFRKQNTVLDKWDLMKNN